MQNKITIELAYASEQKQLISYQTQPGLQAGEIIKKSGFLDMAGINLDTSRFRKFIYWNME